MYLSRGASFADFYRNYINKTMRAKQTRTATETVMDEAAAMGTLGVVAAVGVGALGVNVGDPGMLGVEGLLGVVEGEIKGEETGPTVGSAIGSAIGGG